MKLTFITRRFGRKPTMTDEQRIEAIRVKAAVQAIEVGTASTFNGDGGRAERQAQVHVVEERDLPWSIQFSREAAQFNKDYR